MRNFQIISSHLLFLILLPIGTKCINSEFRASRIGHHLFKLNNFANVKYNNQFDSESVYEYGSCAKELNAIKNGLTNTTDPWAIKCENFLFDS